MKVLIVGLGSIAQKHIEALRKINFDTEIFALRSTKTLHTIKGVKNIYSWNDIPSDIDFIIISNPTSLHLQALKNALLLGKPILLEKPPLMSINGSTELIKEYKTKNILVYTAFNLRFHPIIQWAKKNIEKNKVLEANVYCGSYLPHWRTNLDYRQTYSANAKMGGGVHLDLIHEIDYLIYLFGKPINTTHQFRKISDLEIDSFDSAHYWLNYSNFTASIVLNYYRKYPKRCIEIVTSEDTIMLDLIKLEVRNAHGDIVFNSNEDISDTYFKQLQHFISLTKSNTKPIDLLEEALETLKICLSENEK